MYEGEFSKILNPPDGEQNPSQLPKNIAMFLVKLWRLVNDPKTDKFICWSADGKSFIIKDPALFAKELLPHYYKHNHMTSFVRQLNMYGFHKKVSPDLGGLRCDKDEMEFAHQYFYKECPTLMAYIKRKASSSKTSNQDTAKQPFKPELMSKVLMEVKSLQGRQEQFDTKLGTMKTENEILWREIILLRQKSMTQQKVINKLIHFLVTVVQSRRGGLTVKRRLYPLMIDNSNRPRKKNKLSESQASPTGPVIHELDTSEPGLDSEYIAADIMQSGTPTVQSPESTHEYVEKQEPVGNEANTYVNLTDPGRFLDEIDMSDLPELDETQKCTSEHKEELHLLEIPVEEEAPVPITLLNNKSIGSKPVPVATVRSSKLTAMAANMKKSQQNIDLEVDMEASVDLDDETSDNDTSSPVEFEDIPTVSKASNNKNARIYKKKQLIIDRRLNKGINKGFNNIYGGKSVLKKNSKWHEKDAVVKPLHEEKDNHNIASTSSSKDLSLSCLNSSSTSETNYRDLDNHLESMQAELDNICDLLHTEGCSIDANAFLGLFDSEEPMAYGIADLPLNPELNPESDKEIENRFPEPGNGFNRGLMTYNSSNYDFEDIFLLEDPSSSLSVPETISLAPEQMSNPDSSNSKEEETPSFLENFQ
ncbi:heat shock factor protein isoform X2 [Harpegnathos saltator]|uniref:Heat shock factor protein n=1 Tax=Harpegnathos saltator TaxID=610380 RepID=E2BTM7_HARSA|nr:heat shock factor protein isoform X2 [Harpegnathos saltator]EFN80955.1 Heat shock factor protein [Harpegnathos saltator]